MKKSQDVTYVKLPRNRMLAEHCILEHDDAAEDGVQFPFFFERNGRSSASQLRRKELIPF
jgi:hypothetical protein